MMKQRMMVVLALAMIIAVLTIGSAALVACQARDSSTQEGTTNQDATTTNSSSTVGAEAFTTVTAWGNNIFGQLGNGIPLPFGDDSNTPVEVSNLDGANLKAFAAGGYHSLVLKSDGTVWAWGLNQDGELGDGTNTSSSIPVQVKDLDDPTGYLTGVQAIAAGSSHSLALKNDGTVWAWGSNLDGQLGDSTSADSTVPVQVGDLNGVEAVSAGFGYSLALKDDGTVWAWGSNTSGQEQKISGQLGDGTIASSNTPVEVDDLSGVEAISAGASHALALKDDGTVWAWGDNFFGQLGNETSTDSSTPAQVSDLLGRVEAISAGGSHSLALKDDGTVWAWGSNRFGQLGDGTSTDGIAIICENTADVGSSTARSSCTDSNTPVQVSELDGITAIAAGGAHGLALKNDGTVWAWGSNQNGQLGNGTSTLGTNTMGINTPAKVSELDGVKAIAAGSDYNLAAQ